MINDEIIRDKLYGEFIKPTNQKKNFIGVEIEIPIINLDKKAVDFDVIHKITHEFQKQYSNFQNNKIAHDGNVFTIKNPKTNDIIWCSWTYTGMI